MSESMVCVQVAVAQAEFAQLVWWCDVECAQSQTCMVDCGCGSRQSNVVHASSSALALAVWPVLLLSVYCRYCCSLPFCTSNRIHICDQLDQLTFLAHRSAMAGQNDCEPWRATCDSARQLPALPSKDHPREIDLQSP